MHRIHFSAVVDSTPENTRCRQQFQSGTVPLAQLAGADPGRLRRVMTELANVSTRAAADALNRRGIKTTSGGQWFPMQVHRARHRLGL
jgi:hypothetical protein